MNIEEKCMKDNSIWKSKLGDELQSFIAFMHSQGYIYKAEEYQLHRFDSFCSEHVEYNVATLTQAAVRAWSLQFSNENANTRNYRVSYIRVFAKYLVSIGKDAYISAQTGSSVKTVISIPSFKEFQHFLTIVDEYQYKNSNKYWYFCLEYPLIFRLLYCCGLRISEVCNLSCDNFNTAEGVLTILQSKGPKNRRVFVAPDLCVLCRKYDLKMNDIMPGRLYFFPSKNPSMKVEKTNLERKFKELWKNAFPNWDRKIPTPHSLRHLFTIQKITKWQKEGTDTNVMMPYLSNYLGHSSPKETFYYYHQKQSVFSIIKKFDNHTESIIPEVQNYYD